MLCFGPVWTFNGLDGLIRSSCRLRRTYPSCAVEHFSRTVALGIDHDAENIK